MAQLLSIEELHADGTYEPVMYFPMDKLTQAEKQLKELRVKADKHQQFHLFEVMTPCSWAYKRIS